MWGRKGTAYSPRRPLARKAVNAFHEVLQRGHPLGEVGVHFFDALEGTEELLKVYPSGWRLRVKEAVLYTQVVADAVSRDKATTPVAFLGEEDTICRIQFNVVLGAQLDERPDGLEQLLHSGGMKQDMFQLDKDFGQQVVKNDTRQRRL